MGVVGVESCGSGASEDKSCGFGASEDKSCGCGDSEECKDEIIEISVVCGHRLEIVLQT